MKPARRNGLPTAANFARSVEERRVINRRPSPHVIAQPEGASGFDRLLSRPKIAEAFAAFLDETASSDSINTRAKKLNNFGLFFDYLDKIEASTGISVSDLSQLSQSVCEGYVDWLDGDPNLQSPLDIEPETCRTRYNLLRDFYRWAANAKAYKFMLPEKDLRKVRWAKTSNKRERRYGLSLVEVAAIRAACRKEIKKVIDDFQIGLRAIELHAGIDITGNSLVPFRHREACIASLHKEIRDFDCSYEELRSRFPGLSRVLRNPYFTIEFILPHLFFTARTLIPLSCCSCLKQLTTLRR